MSKDNKLVTTHKHEIQQVPEFLKPRIGGPQPGMEDVEQTDILMPRLGLCQSLSPQRRKGDPAHIPGLEEGQLFNSVTQEIYGVEIKLIALFFFKNRTKFLPIDTGGGIDCTSANAIDQGRLHPTGCASCQYSSFGNGSLDPIKSQEPPLCTLFHNYMAYLPDVDEPTPIAISYKSSGLKFSRELLSKVRISRAPMYAKWYDVTVFEQRDGNNMWFEKRLTPGSYVDEELFGQMDNLFKSLKEKHITVDTTGEEGGNTDFEYSRQGTAGSTEL